MFAVYSSVIKHQTRNAETFWFRQVDIDSLYKDKKSNVGMKRWKTYTGAVLLIAAMSLLIRIFSNLTVNCSC